MNLISLKDLPPGTTIWKSLPDLIIQLSVVSCDIKGISVRNMYRGEMFYPASECNDLFLDEMEAIENAYELSILCQELRIKSLEANIINAKNDLREYKSNNSKCSKVRTLANI